MLWEEKVLLCLVANEREEKVRDAGRVKLSWPSDTREEFRAGLYESLASEEEGRLLS